MKKTGAFVAFGVGCAIIGFSFAVYWPFVIGGVILAGVGGFYLLEG